VRRAVVPAPSSAAAAGGAALKRKFINPMKGAVKQ
jgi:hypothetical protein